jgi:hypothetical protein
MIPCPVAQAKGSIDADGLTSQTVHNQFSHEKLAIDEAGPPIGGPTLWVWCKPCLC